MNQLNEPKTKEIFSLNDLNLDLQECISQYSPLIMIYPENDTMFRMKYRNCTLLQNLLDPKIMIRDTFLQKFKSFNNMIKEWSKGNSFENMETCEYLNF